MYVIVLSNACIVAKPCIAVLCDTHIVTKLYVMVLCVIYCG